MSEEDMLAYDDLQSQLDALLVRMAERMEEKEPEHEPAEWRGDDPASHIHRATTNLNEMKYRSVSVGHRDYNLALTEAADAVNHLLMSLVNHPRRAMQMETDGGVAPSEAESLPRADPAEVDRDPVIGLGDCPNCGPNSLVNVSVEDAEYIASCASCPHELRAPVVVGEDGETKVAFGEDGDPDVE